MKLLLMWAGTWCSDSLLFLFFFFLFSLVTPHTELAILLFQFGLALPQAYDVALDLRLAFHHPENSLPPPEFLSSFSFV